jgi:hypothetical protein
MPAGLNAIAGFPQEKIFHLEDRTPEIEPKTAIQRRASK